jgi:hypothetical protein
MWRKKHYPNMARPGKKNGRWKGGHSKTYYRRITGCKKNDGKIVHHMSRKVLVVLDNRGNSSRAKHNKLHPEKGGFHGVSKKR